MQRRCAVAAVWLSLAVLLPADRTIAADAGTEPTHVEAAPIKFDLGPQGKIETMAMDSRGNLLVGISWAAGGAAAGGNQAAPPRQRPAQPGGARPNPGGPGGARSYAIKVVDPDGAVLATWDLPGLVPAMLHGCDNGDVFVGGGDSLAKLDAQGKLLKSVRIADILDRTYAGAHVSGVTASDKHFFVAFGHGSSLRATEDVVRFDRDLGSPKVIVKQQFGCCAHIDLDVKDDVLLVAENSRHRVNRYTFDGEPLGTWGRRDRTDIAGFAACCNPVNFDFGPGDVLYTAESGVGRVKRYTPDGKYLGLVGYVDTTKFDGGSALAAQSCYIPIEVGAGAKKVYVMDVRAWIIRVLVEKDAKAE